MISMFFNLSKLIIAVSCLLLFIPTETYASEPLLIDQASKTYNSSELIVGALKYDGKIVSFQGEAVGDLMRRGEENWINLYDGKNAIGVVLNPSLANQVDIVGDYKDKGDILLVTGKFNESCDLHRGELDIHAESLMVVQKGHREPHKVDITNVYLAGFVSIWAAIAFYLSRRKHEDAI